MHDEQSVDDRLKVLTIMQYLQAASMAKVSLGRDGKKKGGWVGVNNGARINERVKSWTQIAADYSS